MHTNLQKETTVFLSLTIKSLKATFSLCSSTSKTSVYLLTYLQPQIAILHQEQNLGNTRVVVEGLILFIIKLGFYPIPKR